MASEPRPAAGGCHGDGGPPAALAGPPPGEGPRPERYAIVVVLEAAGPDAAWEAVSASLGLPPATGRPDCIYVGAPWQGVPAEADDLSTDRLDLAMSVPDAGGRFRAVTVELRPCD